MTHQSKGDCCYACPTNKERNSIQSAIFRKHVKATHPTMSSNEMPQTNTIIIEADITSSTTMKSNRKIDSHLLHRIITTCGDANAMFGTKHIDPALCLYKGAIVMCIDNKHLKNEVPRGNGTICRVINFKIKQNAPSYKCKNYYGKKVWTVNAIDVEWVECEHANKTEMILQLETQIHEYTSQLDLIENKTQIKTNQIQVKIDTLKSRLSTIMKYRKFKLYPEQCSPKVSIKQHTTSPRKIQFCCKMKQFQIISNDATTGHKLQGISKDLIVITSWPTGGLAAMFKNWEYVVLSRVRTISGLFLIKPIDMNKSFKPSEELKRYMEYARQTEANMLEKRKHAIAQINWEQT